MAALTTGGFNFDAKLRRQSVDLGDLIHAHVGGIDTLALALLCAERLIDDGRVQAFVEQRYEGWDAPLGQSIQEGVATLASLDAHVQGGGAEVSLRSGRQEALENVVRESNLRRAARQLVVRHRLDLHRPACLQGVSAPGNHLESTLMIGCQGVLRPSQRGTMPRCRRPFGSDSL